MKLGVQVGLGPGHIVLDRDPAPPSPKGHSPQFSAHIYCGQMAGWIMMSLGREVGLGVGDIVLDGDPAPPKRGTPPIFGPRLLWPKGWMDQDATWYGGRLRPTQQCVRWGPARPRPKTYTPPIFGPRLLWLNGSPSQLLLSSC